MNIQVNYFHLQIVQLGKKFFLRNHFLYFFSLFFISWIMRLYPSYCERNSIFVKFYVFMIKVWNEKLNYKKKFLISFFFFKAEITDYQS
jgi:hypothetical protein